ncbi:MAG TPA: hypothetical protein VKA38_01410 [Draconibacterium sp.]|nr:hypothetical protein [Draconibacterium sp.]
MNRFFKRIIKWGFVTGILLLFQSCILKEFKFNEIKLSNDWEMQLGSPLFYGNLEFKDLVYDWKEPVQINTGEPVVNLQFSSDSVIDFPTRLIYEPSAIIDSFNFLIEGDDYLSQASFKYLVTNGSPFPLYLQLRFFEKHSSAAKSPAILPPAFPAAQLENGSLIPVKTEYTLPLTTSQLESFKRGNRIQFVTWFNKAATGFNPDTLSAHYPVELSIVLSGIVHGYYQ